jgi:hypothetical protein
MKPTKLLDCLMPIDRLRQADFIGYLKIGWIVMSARWGFLFLSSFVWLLGSSDCTHAEEWKKQSYPADGFQIEFSGPVVVKETAMSDETKNRMIRATNYLQDSGTAAYFVAAMLVKDSVNFDGGAADGFLASQCQAKKETPVTLSGAEKGLEILGSSCLGNGSHFEERFFQRGKWFYQITAIYTADGDAEAARHFLNSFKLLWQAELERPEHRSARSAS